ncbi:unnamed protein product [Durusdinium trenchii]|uniref:Uncharacterized protein n=2 Tax=Durusdinium trenchii TaxID=1381693 RepID=A0ABP0NYG8_9DINO
MGCAHAKEGSVEESRMLFDPAQKLGADAEAKIEQINLKQRSSFHTWLEKKRDEKLTPPDRRCHDRHVEALDKFLTKVDGSPERFVEIVGIYRDKSGMKDEEEIAVIRL